MYKRMNDVPMMGKRDPELAILSDNRDSSTDYEEAAM